MQSAINAFAVIGFVVVLAISVGFVRGLFDRKKTVVPETPRLRIFRGDAA